MLRWSSNYLLGRLYTIDHFFKICMRKDLDATLNCSRYFLQLTDFVIVQGTTSNPYSFLSIVSGEAEHNKQSQ